MKMYHLLFIVVLLGSFTLLKSQDRLQMDVPMVDPAAITLDGNMDESEWGSAAEINLVTNTGFNIFALYYDRDGVTDPEYDEYYARLLWSEDTLYAFIHIDEVVNDSSDLFWDGQWLGDQLFVSLSSRLGITMDEDSVTYDGNVYLAPEGPYHYLILGDQVTLNNGALTYVPEEYRDCPDDTNVVFEASEYARWAVTIDEETGEWNIEMAIYNPNIASQGCVAFNIGGSQGSSTHDPDAGDAYMYYTWQPSVPNNWEAEGEAFNNGDPGFYNLNNSDYWAILNFVGDSDRLELNVPMVDPAAITLDGNMDESEWGSAAEINLVTNTGFNIFALYYDRDGVTDPEYDEYYARLLWSEDTLYAFIHIDEVVNDSSDLFWDGQWLGDQLFVSLSSRLGITMDEDSVTYDGNVYLAPEGPYHYLILGDQVTLNNGALTYVPEEYRDCPDDTTSEMIFEASEYARWAITIDEETGEWNIEMAIYNPNIASQGCVAFNIGGSQGSSTHDPDAGDAYMYYTWQPSVPNNWEAEGEAFNNGDPGFYNLNNSDYWAILNFTSDIVDVKEDKFVNGLPTSFNLLQNYPNPFNPSTTIKFEVPAQSNISLKIYNIVGEMVATIINNQVMNAGTYSATFDASKLASGIYFYQLEADGFSQSKKMILLK